MIPSSPCTDLTIIGAACRFPGPAYSLEEFHALLIKGVDAITAIPADRFALDRFISASRSIPGHGFTASAGVLPNLLDFDPEFFGISRTEALDMDPQQRMVLEMTWEAMENAGIPPSTLRGSQTGVYMGAAGTDTALRNTDDIVAGSPYTMTGSTLSIIANRVSYLFDLHGPSLCVDTACSSSLVALHMACEALRSGEIPLAVVGGINCLFSPYPFAGFSKSRMLSPDGRCKAFDASGNGYVRSEGGGVVLVTTVEHAGKKGWEPLALIAGTGVNSDGRTAGIALPNPEAQAALIRQVYSRFNLDPQKLVYVEAHGTGTAAGDPLEASAIGQVLGKPLAHVRRLPVGSVKSNIGHLETSAGMAGLLKALLVLRHEEIPANLHFETPNPAIDFNAANILVPTKRMPLPKAGGNELVSINSFGFGGANAHVVLRKAARPRRRPAAKHDPAIPPLLLSAQSAESLRALAGGLAERLEKADAATYRDVACTLAFKRDHLERRVMIAGESPAAVYEELLAASIDEKCGDARAIRENTGKKRSGVFVFSGNGSQWSGMGQSLLAEDAAFRQSLEETDAIFAPLQGWSILDVLQNPENHPDAFSLTEHSQPLIFAVQVGIARALEARGILPAAVIGHSVGEVAAAWCAKALSLEDAALVIHVRSMLQAPLYGKGSMAAANMSVETAEEILAPFGGKVGIAAVNTKTSLSLAGDTEALQAVVAQCKKRRIAAKMLAIPYPFHTSLMDVIREGMDDALSAISPRKPQLPFFSTVLGTALRRTSLDAAYWRRNARQSVLFAPAVRAAYTAGFRFFLEIGASPVLRSYIRDTLKEESDPVFISPTLTRDGHGARELRAVWKDAWRHGWRLDLQRVFPTVYNAVSIPSYPWNREYCWHDESPECNGYLTAKRVHPLLGWQLPRKAPVFENTVHPADFPWINDHVAGKQAVYPAAAFLESMLAAGGQMFPDQGVALERVTLFRPLAFSPDAARALRLSVDREDGGILLEGRSFASPEPWGTYAKGRIVPFAGEEKDCGLAPDAPESFGAAVNAEEVYTAAAKSHLHYGPSFRTVVRAWLKPGPERPEALAELRAPDISLFTGMHIPPTLLDGAFHTLFLLMGNRPALPGKCFLPSAFERVTLVASGVPRYAHARLEKAGSRSIVASFRLFDEKGKTLLVLQNCRFRRSGWLEQENAPSKAYVTEFLPEPHPESARMPKGVTLELLQKAAGQAPRANGNEPDTAAVHPWPLLQLASLAAARESLLSLQGRPEQQARFTCADLLASGKLCLSQESRFHHILQRLESAGFALREDNAWTIPPQDERRNATMLWRTFVASSPQWSCEAALLAHVFASHRSIWRGDFRETEAAALPASLEHAYYANAFSLNACTESARNMVKAALKAAAPGEKLRVLFAGRCPETFISPLEPFLVAGRCDFAVAADNSDEAESGNTRFGLTPAVRFMPLSLENPGKEHAGKYHLIISGWALHDSLNIDLALDEIRNMLHPGGMMLLLEQPPNAFADYIFGSRPSWWRASMSADRPASLLQRRESWEEALRQASFTDISGFGGDHDPAFLILARKQAEERAGAPCAAPPENPDAAEAARPSIDPARQWIIIGRAKGTASSALAGHLGKALREAGEDVAVFLDGDVVSGETFTPRETRCWQTVSAARNAGSLPHILYLGGYDDVAEPSAAEQEDIRAGGTLALAALARAWGGFGGSARLWILAGGAFGNAFRDERPVPSQGAILGFTRVLSNELRSAAITFLDLHGDAASMISSVVRELLCPAAEPEIILTPDQRYVPRLSGYAGAATANAATAVKLDFDQPGRLRNLHWQQIPPGVPGEGEVRVKVSHTGLNFRDVMWSMGLLPDEALENGFSGAGLGIECSGVIDAVGKGVTEFAEGDAVLCFAPSCFGSHVVTRASAVAKKPSSISFAQAATIPVAFITAWYSLHHLARMQRGQRVLIHGAAGGVGLAAIQIASHMGLEIYATAGAREKHHFLQRLGITRLYSSRSLSFADAIRKDTNGEGVDCVLNSLSGEAAAAGVGILRPFGHFIELGKRDFFADSPMRLRPFSNNLTYCGVDVDQLIIHKPELARSLFSELMKLFAKRELLPLPFTAYSAANVVDAFQAMQQSSHMGKLVVSLEGAEMAAGPLPAPRLRWPAKPDATYLISGGSSGLGLACAAFLARRGARHLLLLSRRGVTGEDERAVVASLRDDGVTVVDARTDIADMRKLQSCLRKKLAGLPPLAGVVHAAAALDDGMIPSLTPEHLAVAFNAKAAGAWNLHRITREMPLDFFTLFSSATTVFGNPGQAGYVAANCMLESLAAWRKKKGLPAQVIGWGPIDDTGMLTRNPKARQMLLQRLGIAPTPSAEAMRWFEQCIAGDIAGSFYFNLDWRNRADLAILASPRFSLLRPHSASVQAGDGSHLEAIRTAGPQEGVRLVTAALLHEVAAVLRLPADKIPADAPLTALGMDSLMAVELALAVEQKFELTGFTLPLTDKTTAHALAVSIHALVVGAKPETDQHSDIMEKITLKHGVRLSSEQRGAMLGSLTGAKNDS